VISGLLLNAAFSKTGIDWLAWLALDGFGYKLIRLSI
jgi:hypothetical protein